jgi:hypothetical protein
MILTGEYGEFLSYFPEYENIFHEVQSFLDAYLSQLNDDLEQAKQKASLPRKDFALWAKEQTNPGFLFAWLDQKVETSQQFVENMRLENLAKILENLRDEVQ